jgi:hypothetical protein
LAGADGDRSAQASREAFGQPRAERRLAGTAEDESVDGERGELVRPGAREGRPAAARDEIGGLGEEAEGERRTGVRAFHGAAPERS